MYRLLQSDFILLFYQNGLAALILAVLRGYIEAVDVLVRAGADVNLQENVSEPVYSQHSNHLCHSSIAPYSDTPTVE